MIVGEQTHVRNILKGELIPVNGRMRISRGGEQTFYHYSFQNLITIIVAMCLDEENLWSFSFIQPKN